MIDIKVITIKVSPLSLGGTHHTWVVSGNNGKIKNPLNPWRLGATINLHFKIYMSKFPISKFNYPKTLDLNF